MKNVLIRYFFAVLLVGASAFSCSGTGKDVQEHFFEVNPVEIQADPSGDQVYITVRSSEDWLVRSEASWARPETSAGKGSSETTRVSIVFDANTEASSRSTILKIKTVKGLQQEVKVSQKSGANVPSSARGIGNAQDLMDFAVAVNEGKSLGRFMKDGVVVLLGDIDVSAIHEWVPIGTRQFPFAGKFDGKGFSIYNVSWKVNVSEIDCAGLFGYVKGATLKGISFGRRGDAMEFVGGSGPIALAALVGIMDNSDMMDCANNVSIKYMGASDGKDLHLGGLVASQTSGSVLDACKNMGNVITQSIGRVAGLSAYNEGEVKNCTNEGIVLSSRSGEIGPAWGCSYNKNYNGFEQNTGHGHVGDYLKYKDSPESAPSDAYLNAVASPAKEGYDLAKVTVDWTKDSYYDWTEIEAITLASGAKYTKYSCDNVPRMINILEIDLSNPKIEITTSFANDCVPNPNGNKNSNNGFNIRETLSQLCERKRSEGIDIVAGINSGFFDSNDGITRGFHIQDGEPVYINNPSVVKALVNHSWAFTVFTDGTASCGKKSFSGKIEVAGKEYPWYTMNDTTLRHSSSQYQINLYDSHYRKQPHPSVPSLTNPLAGNVLYVIAEYVDSPMKVNCGYAIAKIVSIEDGRSRVLSEPPYIKSDKQVGIALSGNAANSIIASVSKGDIIKLRCDIEIEGGIRKPILTQNSSMFRLMIDGKDNTSSIPGSNQSVMKQDPVTFPVVSADGKKVWLVEVDGRQGWYSTGVRAYEMYRIAKKLGGSSVTRLDGGGSSVMWVYDRASGKGKVANSVSDSKGERSCMNYILIRAK